MIAGKWPEPHDWLDGESVDDWITSDRARQNERLPHLQMLVSFIPFTRDEKIRVLDVGAGYGLLSEMVLEAFPNAHVTCHDYSEHMFARARERLKGHASRVSLVMGDLWSPDWTKDLKGPFEAIVSSIAIHNVRSRERIRSIYHELFPFVTTGGCFLNVDHVGPAGRISARFYHSVRLLERQRRLKEQQGIERSLEELEDEWQERQKTCEQSDGPGRVSLEEQFHWLREAGFDEVECFWKDMGRAIIAGYRSPAP